MPRSKDTFSTLAPLPVEGRRLWHHGLDRLAAAIPSVRTLPVSLKVLLENLLRHEDGRTVTRAHIEALAHWDGGAVADVEVPFTVSRVLLQDFTGVPAVVDLAALREAVAAWGGDAARVRPACGVDLVVDHSVTVEHFGSVSAEGRNVEREYARNRERYELLRWASRAFDGLRVVPPGKGICHQVNLEVLASCVSVDGDGCAHPDTLVGTDSHTPMVNALGVLGWGVGGIEAEAALLGHPVTLKVPEVVGVRLEGALPPGATAADAVLAVTERLRRHGVVGRFVEYFGPGVASLSLSDRASLSNMAPEYGATVGLFPVDDETLAYLRLTGRDDAHVALVAAYCRAQGLWRTEGAGEPRFTEVVAVDLAELGPCLAGPSRPQDRVLLAEAKRALPPPRASVVVEHDGGSYELNDGAVVIAALTSCTHTANPDEMLAAGLLAKAAVERGLSVRPWVKSSLAPGSRVVTDYLSGAGLLPYLEALGFHPVGYGCTTCIGNSGPLPPAVARAVEAGGLEVASVLSGNRNFEGRIHPQVRHNFLASPPLVVAYALAGSLHVDVAKGPLAHDREGEPVRLGELWPSPEALEAARRAVSPVLFRRRAEQLLEGDAGWEALATAGGALPRWEPASTYIRRPPFLDALPRTPPPLEDILGARVLLWLGDSVTTDHISPAGSIAAGSPAAEYLLSQGVAAADFHGYGARRGNHEVMVRGTFASPRLRNRLVPGVEGGYTLHGGERVTVFEASGRYRAAGTPLVVLAGAEYGTGSSRDWAAKGTALLGVRAVLAKSFERIHRSNLVGMGVLPLQFLPGEDAQSLGLRGDEPFDILGLSRGLRPAMPLRVRAGERQFEVTCRVDTPSEVAHCRHGGLLPYVLRSLLD